VKSNNKKKITVLAFLFSVQGLKRIFGRNREEVADGWRRLHNEENRKVYASPNIVRLIKSKEDEMGRTCSTHGRKHERKRPLRRPKRRWEENITIDLWKTEWIVVNWMHMAQHGYQWRTAVNTVMDLRVP
jgi:hypothetical protein